jgi:hypothetical protein
MRPSVYIETTIVSYLTAWPDRDVVVAGHQRVTKEWWETRREGFDIFASQLVVQEAGSGDAEAARERLEVLRQVRLLKTKPEAVKLAKVLLKAHALPPKAGDDALHLAIAATNGVGYLLTWNCRHLANAVMRSTIESAIAKGRASRRRLFAPRKN